MMNAKLYTAFSDHLKAEFAETNLEFYRDATLFSMSSKSGQEIRNAANVIIYKFLSSYVQYLDEI